ncbi:AAA family ATPase [Candidatus Woesearchaeota archaeon]|nr:AAA family ATPase [Candidatus Woesearchaeota archaeon]
MTRFIALVSGKGGVGKTTIALNLGHALHRLGKQVILVDANLATPNLGLQLGLLNPEGTLNKFLRKEKGLHEVIYRHESGIALVPSSLNLVEYQKTNPQKLTELFEHLDEMSEFVVVDAPSGLGYEVNQILKNSDETLIIINPTLSSVMDALKTVQLAHMHNSIVAGIILNMTHFGGWNELKQEKKKKIIGYPIIANIRYDGKFRKALLKQAPVHYLYPRSRTAREFKNVAKHLCLHQGLGPS